MTTTDTTDPWWDENNTSIAVGDWVLFRDRERTIIERVAALVVDDLGPHLRLHNDDDPPPGHVIRLDPFPADADEPDWFHDSIGNRWVGPVGDGTIVVEIFGDELALLQAAVRQAADVSAITFARQAGSREYTFGGGVQADVSISLTCWAATWLVARNGAEAMRVALDTYQGGDIDVASVTDGSDYYDPEADLFGCTVIVAVNYSEV